MPVNTCAEATRTFAGCSVRPTGDSLEAPDWETGSEHTELRVLSVLGLFLLATKEGGIDTEVVNVTLVERKILFFLLSFNFI